MKEPKLKGIAYPEDEDEDYQHEKLLGNEEGHVLAAKKIKAFDLNAFPDTEIEYNDSIQTLQTRSTSPPQTLKNDLVALASDPNKGMVFVRTPRLDFTRVHNGTVINCSHLHHRDITKFGPLYKGNVTSMVNDPNRGGIYNPLIVQKSPRSSVSHGNFYPMNFQVHQPFAQRSVQPLTGAKTRFHYNVDDYAILARRCGEQQLQPPQIPNSFIPSTDIPLRRLQNLEPTSYGLVEPKGKTNKLCIYAENLRCPHGSACPFLHESPSSWQYTGESSRGKRKLFSDDDAKGRDQIKAVSLKPFYLPHNDH